MPYSEPGSGAGKHRDWITLGAAGFPWAVREGTIRTYIAQPDPEQHHILGGT